jgi:hypothetical protein
LTIQECWKHGKINFQASGGLKDLSISASTRENQSSFWSVLFLLDLQVFAASKWFWIWNCRLNYWSIANISIQVGPFVTMQECGNTAILISKIDIFPTSLRTCNLCSNYNFLSFVSRLMATVLGDFYPWSIPGFSWYHCIFDVWFSLQFTLSFIRFLYIVRNIF